MDDQRHHPALFETTENGGETPHPAAGRDPVLQAPDRLRFLAGLHAPLHRIDRRADIRDGGIDGDRELPRPPAQHVRRQRGAVLGEDLRRSAHQEMASLEAVHDHLGGVRHRTRVPHHVGVVVTLKAHLAPSPLLVLPRSVLEDVGHLFERSELAQEEPRALVVQEHHREAVVLVAHARERTQVGAPADLQAGRQRDRQRDRPPQVEGRAREERRPPPHPRRVLANPALHAPDLRAHRVRVGARVARGQRHPRRGLEPDLPGVVVTILRAQVEVEAHHRPFVAGDGGQFGEAPMREHGERSVGAEIFEAGEKRIAFLRGQGRGHGSSPSEASRKSCLSFSRVAGAWPA